MEIHSTKAEEGHEPDTAFFFYGATGSGKTLAASTFPDPLFMIPANEGSHLSLRDRDLPYTILGEENGKRVKVRQQMFRNLQQLKKQANEMHAWLAKADELEDSGASEDKVQEMVAKAFEVFPYRTIVNESLTHLNELIVEEISDTGSQKSRGSMDQQKWGELATFYRNVHNALRSLPVHIVYTCLDTYDSDKDAGEPYISGKTSSVLPSACDAVGYCEAHETTGGTVYRVHFRSYKNRRARSRFKAIPRIVTDFDFEVLREEGLFRG